MPGQANDTLIGRAQRGDTAAIAALYEQHRTKVFRYLYYRVGNQQIAEDLTTEVFIRVIQALPAYKPQKNIPFQAWMFRITHNLMTDHYRHQMRQKIVELDEQVIVEDGSPDQQVEHTLTSERLRQALLRLTDDQREVILLRLVAEFSIEQVAKTLNKSESAVKALQRRGLDALQHILTQGTFWHEKPG